MEQNNDWQTPVVFVKDEKVLGTVLKQVTGMALVQFVCDGEMHTVWMEDDEYILIDNIIFKYVDEEDPE